MQQVVHQIEVVEFAPHSVDLVQDRRHIVRRLYKTRLRSETKNIPAISCPLNLTSTSCGMAMRGVKEARKRRLPLGWIVHGTDPPLISISKSPAPACTVSTIYNTRAGHCKQSSGFPTFGFNLGQRHW